MKKKIAALVLAGSIALMGTSVFAAGDSPAVKAAKKECTNTAKKEKVAKKDRKDYIAKCVKEMVEQKEEKAAPAAAPAPAEAPAPAK